MLRLKHFVDEPSPGLPAMPNAPPSQSAPAPNIVISRKVPNRWITGFRYTSMGNRGTGIKYVRDWRIHA